MLATPFVLRVSENKQKLKQKNGHLKMLNLRVLSSSNIYNIQLCITQQLAYKMLTTHFVFWNNRCRANHYHLAASLSRIENINNSKCKCEWLFGAGSIEIMSHGNVHYWTLKGVIQYINLVTLVSVIFIRQTSFCVNHLCKPIQPLLIVFEFLENYSVQDVPDLVVQAKNW